MKLEGKIQVVSDKSMTHRALLLGAISEGITTIYHPLIAQDTLSTYQALEQLGVRIEKITHGWKVYGKPIEQWKTKQVLNVGNSGTTIRLLSGILSAIPYSFTLTGDHSLQKRPMGRIIRPLEMMGATFKSNKQKAPFTITGGTLKAIDYTLPQASAQVKSAIILAGLNTAGTTTIHEPIQTRNHTETMLPLFGGKITCHENTITINGPQQLKGTTLTIPGDISSAAFFIGAATITQGSHVQIENVGVNDTRIGLLNILRKMGACITLLDKKEGVEPIATIDVRYSKLKGITITKEDIPSLIDELPLIALIATQAHGVTVIKDAEELAYKETNRLVAIYELLSKLGANISLKSDGWIIKGPTQLKGAFIHHYKDHRIAMVAKIANLITSGEVTMNDEEIISISYPTFIDDLSQLIVNI